MISRRGVPPADQRTICGTTPQLRVRAAMSALDRSARVMRIAAAPIMLCR